MILRMALMPLLIVLPPLVLRALGWPLHGSFLGIPYDFRAPTPSRIKTTLWNRESDRLLAPHVYGWGYSMNLHALGRKLGLLKR
jgi:hypothetical protein